MTQQPQGGDLIATLSSDVLQQRIDTFYGFGNLSSDIWYIGMEEGFSGSVETLVSRIKATSHQHTFDIQDDMQMDSIHMRMFKEGAPTQPTYRKLIYLHLFLKNRTEPTIEDIRDFQIHQLGRKNADHALLELMPLPAQSLASHHWLYRNAQLAGLTTRSTYLKMYKPKRVEQLRMLIQTHKPKLVVCYSLQYIKDWEELAGVTLEERVPKQLYTGKTADTLLAVIPHSAAHGLSSQDWKQIAVSVFGLL